MLLVSGAGRAGQAPPDPRLGRLKDAIDDAATRGYVRGSSSTVDHSAGGLSRDGGGSRRSSGGGGAGGGDGAVSAKDRKSVV